MTDKEFKESLKKMKEFQKKLLADKELAWQFLLKTGIYEKDGSLSKHYK